MGLPNVSGLQPFHGCFTHAVRLIYYDSGAPPRQAENRLGVKFFVDIHHGATPRRSVLWPTCNARNESAVWAEGAVPNGSESDHGAINRITSLCRDTIQKSRAIILNSVKKAGGRSPPCGCRPMSEAESQLIVVSSQFSEDSSPRGVHHLTGIVRQTAWVGAPEGRRSRRPPAGACHR
jgi:hypothetical protein